MYAQEWRKFQGMYYAVFLPGETEKTSGGFQGGTGEVSAYG